MGNSIFGKGSSKHSTCTADGHINFTCFTILRSIGRGSYGKVCIAQKNDSKKLYAMKYMNKVECIKEGAVVNIIEELKLLRCIQHDHIVNLRFAFHDFEDMCLVVDLLQGGDLRYHLSKSHRFSERDVSIYMLELSSALDYLRTLHIIHRDIKPENLLLGIDGHIHLTDFNVATKLQTSDSLLHSETGTWSYMAPEIFSTRVGATNGYSYSVDWWSLAVTCYELYHGQRPFDRIPDTAEAAVSMFNQTSMLKFSSSLSSSFCSLLNKMLVLDTENRLMSHSAVSSKLGMTMDEINSGKLTPSFMPSKKLNVDPAHELEELIMESKPIHKKRSRLSKGSSIDSVIDEKSKEMLSLIEQEFKPFNYLCRPVSESGDLTADTGTLCQDVAEAGQPDVT